MKNVSISWKMALPLLAILLSSVFTSCSDDDKKMSDLTGFLSFGFSDESLANYEFTIGSDNVITNQIALPYGFDASALTPTFSTAPLAMVNIAGVDFVSGTSAIDFTEDVVFTVVAEDGDNTLNYTVRVNVASTLSAWTNLSPNAGLPLYTDISAFEIGGKFFVVGGLKGGLYGGHESGLFSSTDGASFTAVSTSIFHDYGIAIGSTPVKHGDNQLLIGGCSYADYDDNGLNGANSANQKVWSSTDGITWEKLTVTETDPAKAVWGMYPEINSFSARSHAAVANMNGDLYLVGGFGYFYGSPQVAIADAWKSTDGGVTWTNLEANFGDGFVARANSQLLVYKDELYLIGGRNQYLGSPQMYYNEIYKSADGTNWTKVDVVTPFDAVAGHTCYVYNDRMILIGGNADTGEVDENENQIVAPSNAMWVSEDAGVNWTKVAEGGLPEGFAGRAGHGLVKDGNKVHVFGGMGVETDGSTKVLTDSWEGTLN
ncbi:DUF6242 domain-containing protein [Ancylomarina sp. 16SWW S1-10-2]|uniref:DUF6242 domain-containing protein n=1 Tax=Ancylomarina sp. 16SWW S1-10-2 TaxID=2499681 RepID=UPI0012ADC414|nr:DUF6242 domain-containing protein [Ancylomarina sp. 16SWW S1-10-2]MRT94669.1 exo-alpha-sialidase [Ancylomarina sp. 16SWW S1-10-2]